METCATCRFYVPQRPQHGFCHRYPQAVTIGPEYWCGEYRMAPQEAGDVVDVDAEAAWWLAHQVARAISPARPVEMAEKLGKLPGRVAAVAEAVGWGRIQGGKPSAVRCEFIEEWNRGGVNDAE